MGIAPFDLDDADAILRPSPASDWFAPDQPSDFMPAQFALRRELLTAAGEAIIARVRKGRG